jgi:hypothetical protein
MNLRSAGGICALEPSRTTFRWCSSCALPQNSRDVGFGELSLPDRLLENLVGALDRVVS